MSQADIQQWIKTPPETLVVRKDSWGRCPWCLRFEQCGCAADRAEADKKPQEVK